MHRADGPSIPPGPRPVAKEDSRNSRPVNVILCQWPRAAAMTGFADMALIVGQSGNSVHRKVSALER
jgi:hypothetical protein